MTGPVTISPGAEAVRRTDPGTRDVRMFLRPVEFALVLFQLAILLGVAWLFQIEVERGFASAAPLILGGFAVHAWLPERLRLPFFVFLTVAVILLLMGPVHGALLLGIGLGIVGICHLPIHFRARVAVVIAVGAALAVTLVRGWGGEWTGVVIPVVGAVFMFRLALYLYDLGTEKSPATPWQRIGYFFMLPNVFFPLFPVVDYNRWLDGYYSRDARDIYQKGLQWMLRGLTHLIMYRIVYHLLPRVDELGGPVGMLAVGAFTYGLYLRISGLFHLITGMLCLFGFDLPPTHNRYFLASGFNDLWRRANIYFKDFMMKLVFYPLVNVWRRSGLARSMGLAAVLVGVASWQLHSYQWFWLQGIYPLTRTDTVFWLTLGLGMTANTVWEARRGRKRPAGRSGWSLADAVGRSVRTVAFFVFLSQMWLLWDSGTFSDWSFRISRAADAGPGGWIAALALLAAVIAIGTLAQLAAARRWKFRRLERPGFQRLATTTAVAGLAVLLVGLRPVHEALGDYPTRVVNKARSTELNRIDQERRIQGYYETLTRSVSFTPLWDAGIGGQREEWRGRMPVRARNDILIQEVIPGFDAVYKGKRLTTNRWGMRDRDYTLEKPPGTIRIVALGGSIVMGAGVADGKTFEALMEDELNRRGDTAYEILNFAVPNTAPHQLAIMARARVPQFAPDAVHYFAHHNEGSRVAERLWTANRGDKPPIDEPVIADVLDRAGVRRGMSQAEVLSRLEPYNRRIVRHAYDTVVATAREAGAVPVWIYIPVVEGARDVAAMRRWAAEARAAGFRVVLLDDVYDGYPTDDLKIAPWDDHPNELGHRLIARRLLNHLRSDPDLLGGPADPARVEPPEPTNPTISRGGRP